MTSHPVLICFALTSLAIGTGLGRRLRACQRSAADRDPRAAESQLTVIIPARNEERNLPKLLESIQSQPVRPLEVIVVDDHSIDRTVEVARQSGAAVVSSPPLPDGWRGKTWACEQGARAARGELLLFIDADAWFAPDGLRQLVAAYDGGAFSLGPWHAVLAPYEQLSLFFNLVMNLGTIPGGLFGQVLLVDRESYNAVGGHGAVRGRTLENFHLAGMFRERGISATSRTGRGMICFRMYPNGTRELIDGWSRGFASGAGATPVSILGLIVAWMGGLLLPFWAAGRGDAITAAAVYCAFVAQVYWLARKVGNFRWYAALAYPLPLIFFFVVFTRSALRIGANVTWKGRVIRAD